MNILYITYDGLLDPVGQSQIIPYLNGLSTAHKIYILSLEKKSQKKIQIDPKIIWIKKNFFKTNIKFLKLINVVKLIISARKVLKNNLIDIVHCRGHIPAFVAYLLNCFYKKKILFDFRGFWIDERFDNNLLTKKNIIHLIIFYLFKFLEKRILLQSSKIIVLTSTARLYLIKKFKISKNLIFIIPCFTDFNFFKKIKKKNSKNNFINICYFGSYGPIYMFEEMFNFFVNLKTKNIKFFLFINNLSEFKKSEIYKKYYYNNKILVKKIYRHQLSSNLSNMDYLICFIKPTFARVVGSFPIKLAEALANGVPVVYNNCMKDVNFYMKKNNLNIKVNLKKLEYNKLKKNSLINKINISEQYKKILDISVGIKLYNLVYEK